MKTTIGKSSKSHSGTDARRDPSLHRVFAPLATASMFSANAQEIVRLAYRSSSSLDDLQRLIQADPSVVALILRRVNSAYYRLDEQVQDVTSAGACWAFASSATWQSPFTSRACSTCPRTLARCTRQVCGRTTWPWRRHRTSSRACAVAACRQTHTWRDCCTTSASCSSTATCIVVSWICASGC